MNNQSQASTCLHCSARLRANSNSNMCQRCRMQGHQEFGTCARCAQPPVSVKTVTTTDRTYLNTRAQSSHKRNRFRSPQIPAGARKSR